MFRAKSADWMPVNSGTISGIQTMVVLILYCFSEEGSHVGNHMTGLKSTWRHPERLVTPFFALGINQLIWLRVTEIQMQLYNFRHRSHFEMRGHTTSDKNQTPKRSSHLVDIKYNFSEFLKIGIPERRRSGKKMWQILQCKISPGPPVKTSTLEPLHWLTPVKQSRY